MRPKTAYIRAIAALRQRIQKDAPQSNLFTQYGVRTPEVVRAHKARQLDLCAVEVLQELIRKADHGPLE